VERHQQDEGPGGKQQCRAMNLAEISKEVPQLGEGGIAFHIHTAHLAELADDHQHRDTGHVTDQHRMGQQVGQEAEPGKPADQADHAHRERKRRGCRRIALLITGDQHGDRRRGHQRGAGFRTDGELAGRAEDGIDQQRADRGPQPGDGRQSGDLRVCHDLGNEVGRDRHAREQVSAQPAPLIFPENRNSRQEAAGPGRRTLCRCLVRHTPTVSGTDWR
jgi:hypothetical protein